VKATGAIVEAKRKLEEKAKREIKIACKRMQAWRNEKK
jgi:hypothetical protein